MVDASGADERRDALDSPEGGDELAQMQETSVVDVGRRVSTLACGAFATVMIIAATVHLTLYITRDTLRYLPSLAANHLIMTIAASVLMISGAAMAGVVVWLADELSVWQKIGRVVQLMVIFAILMGLQAWSFENHELAWWLLIVGSPAGFAALCIRACRPAQG